MKSAWTEISEEQSAQLYGWEGQRNECLAPEGKFLPKKCIFRQSAGHAITTTSTHTKNGCVLVFTVC